MNCTCRARNSYWSLDKFLNKCPTILSLYYIHNTLYNQSKVQASLDFLSCSVYMYSTYTVHVLYMYYTCIHVQYMYMYCTCTVHIQYTCMYMYCILYMYSTCTVCGLNMYYICTIHVLYMYCTCTYSTCT